jgi:hypothetical protein
MCISIEKPSASGRVVQPVRPVGAAQPEDQRVDDAPLRVQHEAHRQDRRDRRHRPRQDEDQRQDLDPPALLDQEARQQQRDHHLQVDRDEDEDIVLIDVRKKIGSSNSLT